MVVSFWCTADRGGTFLNEEIIESIQDRGELDIEMLREVVEELYSKQVARSVKENWYGDTAYDYFLMLDVKKIYDTVNYWYEINRNCFEVKILDVTTNGGSILEVHIDDSKLSKAQVFFLQEAIMSFVR